MSRKLAREVAFKIVFSNSFQTEKEKEELLEETNQLIENLAKDTEILNDIVEDTNSEKTSLTSEDITTEDKNYIQEVTAGVFDKTNELDEKIKMYLKGWTMERISKADLAILRLAIFEILYREDIPYKVSINEAVELAKKYGEDSSPSFINGVLAALINSLA